MHAVLKNLNFVGLGNKRVEAHADLTLACSTYFVVMYFNVEAHLLHGGTHGSADVVQ